MGTVTSTTRRRFLVATIAASGAAASGLNLALISSATAWAEATDDASSDTAIGKPESDKHDQTQNKDYGSKNPGYNAGNRQGIGTEFLKSRHLEGMNDNPYAEAHKQYGSHKIGLRHVFLFHSIFSAEIEL